MERTRVWAEVDRDAVANNFRLIAERTGRQVMVVLKADGYGLGAAALAHTVEQAGAAMIGVGDSSEALELRRTGIRVPIVILGAIVDGEVEAVLRYRVSTTLHSRDRLRSLAQMAGQLGCRAVVHLMVDTGMGRLGVPPQQALDLLAEVAREPRLMLEGLATHFSSPEDPDFTRYQLQSFLAVIEQARAAGLPTGACHAAASVALWRYRGTHLDMVRPGMSLLGCDPSGLGIRAVGFRPALALRSQVIFLKDFPAGAPIGYYRTYHTRSTTRIATIPVGYNDGLPLSCSNRAEVLVRGQRAPVVGRISMDYATIDVGHIEDVQVGDQVTLIGTDGSNEVNLEEIAARAGTIPHAITCGLGKRVRRRYLGGQPTAPFESPIRIPQRFDFATLPTR
jgi:alanine racemase